MMCRHYDNVVLHIRKKCKITVRVRWFVKRHSKGKITEAQLARKPISITSSDIKHTAFPKTIKTIRRPDS